MHILFLFPHGLFLFYSHSFRRKSSNDWLGHSTVLLAERSLFSLVPRKVRTTGEIGERAPAVVSPAAIAMLRSAHYLRLQPSSLRKEGNSGWQGGALANSIRNVGKLDLDFQRCLMPYHFAGKRRMRCYFKATRQPRSTPVSRKTTQMLSEGTSEDWRALTKVAR